MIASLHAAPPTTAALVSVWTEQLPALTAAAHLPLPAMEEADWQALSSGRIVKKRVREPGADRAVGVAWMAHEPDAIWLAILDDKHDTLVSGLYEQQLPGTRPDFKILYQHLDLPFPFEDRHWVLNLENNAALYAATGGWERIWSLDPRAERSLPPGALPAIWTPLNEGGWWLLPGEGGALVVYQVRTDVGGMIPDDVVVRYAMATLDEMMDHIDQRAAVIPDHYDSAHEPILRPDRQPVPPWPR